MSKSLFSFNSFNDSQAENYIASNLPKGKFWANRFDSDSNLYKLLNCLATFISMVTSQIYTFIKNMTIGNIQELMPEWQASVKLNDNFPQMMSNTGQNNQIKRLISKIPVYNIRGYRSVNDYTTMESYIKIMTGYDVVILPGSLAPLLSAFPILFPIIFTSSAVKRTLSLIIEPLISGGVVNNHFPIPFPVTFFNSGLTPELERAINNALFKIVPSFMGWYFRPKYI
jgi:hypothetical protein